MSQKSKKSAQDFAVIFDMDGVIVDSNPYHKIALEEFVNRYGFQLSEEEMRNKIFGRTNRDWLTRLFDGKITEEQLRRLEHEKESLFREIYRDAIEPVTGLKGFLEQLRAHRIVRAIATSAPTDNVKFTLEKTGIESYFEVIIDGNSVHKSKPDPEIYLKTIKKVNFPAAQCVVIEDSLSGIKSAQEAGCKIIGITTTHTRQELSQTQLVINDFTELSVNRLNALF